MRETRCTATTECRQLIPLPIICGFVIGMVAFCSIRTTFNTDVILTNHSKRPEDRLDRLLHPTSTKLLWFTQVYEPNQELYDLYEDMKQAEEEQKKKAAAEE